ncbi:hypothetical protein GOP47_0017309 [Adiantum capillus-veneris]|uniref:Protein kinase domain-containing protein n=1 Tax=Adiantum capillus-veneris TaxID=13818 RepID=A0A9D4UGC7_ADICA|nr:hypothetical protein GOP47_0017309 [Adiantum capillus-veneris]
MGYSAFYLLVFSCYVGSLYAGFFAHALPTEGMTLLVFKEAVADPHGALAGWNASHSSPCNWTGIWCDPLSKKVISIDLAGKGLSGVLVAELGSLKKLHRMYLHYNNFYGGIPLQLANCTRMRALSLHHNNFSGIIPPQFGNFSLLQALYLHNNHLSGPIPMTFGNLNAIRNLDLSYNTLNGSIPSELGNLSNVVNLNLSYNQLSGPVPSNGVLSKFGNGSFFGNIQLCGSEGFSACSPPSSAPVSVNNLVAPSNPGTSKGAHRLSTLAIAGICIGAFLLFKAVCILTLLWRWSKIRNHKEINVGNGGKLVMFQGGTSMSSSRDLLKGIGKLERKDVIGEGGYGVVYKLVQKDSNVFAVKKLKHCLESVRGFEAELETLGSIKHRNLVKLMGYCTSSTVKLLIYEFLPNGTLGQLLYGQGSDVKPLEWPIRHGIALGVARGLAYLHHDCNPRIIHRDITASNVLLDANLQAHITDFGLARILGLYDTHVTATVAGTFGYIAPEYAEGGRATDKIDVYSFGVVLLELLSRKRPADGNDGEDLGLAAWARRLHESGKGGDIVEKYLRVTAPLEELQTAVLVALSCISKKPENRPSMKQVVEYLEMDELHLSTAATSQITETAEGGECKPDELRGVMIQ